MLGGGSFLLDEGIELQLSADIKEVLGKVQEHSASFTYQDSSYTVIPLGGRAGSLWMLGVGLKDGQSIGVFSIEKLDNGTTLFKVAPRSQWGNEQPGLIDHDGSYFTSFLLELFKTFVRERYVDLPGLGR